MIKYERRITAKLFVVVGCVLCGKEHFCTILCSSLLMVCGTIVRSIAFALCLIHFLVIICCKLLFGVPWF
ncbi:hypothetical protein V1524DRAFT_435550 [Lipomyces starkeyi]